PSGENATDHTLWVCPASLVRSRPLSASQSVVVPSQLPVASVLPSGDIATPAMAPTSRSVARSGPVPSFQSLRDTGERAGTARAFRVARSLPVATSHNLAVPSALPLAKVLPSGEKSTESVAALCSLKVINSRPDPASHNLTVWSSPAEANRLPSGENLTEK